jgi:sRNA-binding regulator protein Hfq
VRLPSAKISGTLECDNSTFTNPDKTALSADGITVNGHMFLRNGFKAQGEVRLPGAKIGGALECDNSTFTNPDKTALNADRITVNDSVFLRNRFKAQGEVQLFNAKIGGQLACTNGTFTNPDKTALNTKGMTVDGDGFLRDGFAAHGKVSLLGATIGKNLRCTNGAFDGQNYALDEERLTVADVFDWQPARRPAGKINLTDAQVGELRDGPDVWPSSGASSSWTASPMTASSQPVPPRTGWPGSPRHYSASAYAPQPYEQLTACFRRSGRDADARTVLVGKHHALRASLPTWMRP